MFGSYESGGHILHVVAPGKFANLPCVHNVHGPRVRVFVYLPTSQGVHESL